MADTTTSDTIGNVAEANREHAHSYFDKKVMSFFSAIVDASITGLGGLLGFTMGGATGGVLRLQRVRSGSGENEKTADWETRMDGHSK